MNEQHANILSAIVKERRTSIGYLALPSSLTQCTPGEKSYPVPQALPTSQQQTDCEKRTIQPKDHSSTLLYSQQNAQHPLQTYTNPTHAIVQSPTSPAQVTTQARLNTTLKVNKSAREMLKSIRAHPQKAYAKALVYGISVNCIRACLLDSDTNFDMQMLEQRPGTLAIRLILTCIIATTSSTDKDRVGLGPQTA